MNARCLERLLEKPCKIVLKDPGDDRSHVMTGTLTDVDVHAGFIIIETAQGPGCINIDAIIAIKPRRKKQN